MSAKKRIALVVGHGPIKDKGAKNKNGVTELVWNTDLASRIVAHIGDRVPVSLIFRRVEGQPPIAAVNKSNATIAVELHLNAFDEKASGTEMIYWPTSTRGKALAAALQKAAVSVLKLADRGIKGPQAGGRGAAFLRKTDMAAVIAESFFIDNSSDLAKGTFAKDELAKAYADALVAMA